MSVLTITAGLLLSSAGGLHAALTVNGSVASTLSEFSGAAVFTTAAGPNSFNQRNVNNSRANTQTFSVGTAFTLDAVYIAYENAGFADGDITLSIYNVADVNAPTLSLGSLVVSGTFASNAGSRVGWPGSDGVTHALKFDFTGSDEVPLAASVGTAGYALQFTTSTGGGGVFQWQRLGNVYAGGSSYEAGVQDAGTLDYAMAITAVPEPSAMALFGFSGAALLVRRRRK